MAFAIILMVSASTAGKSQVFQEGDKLLNIGIGLGSNLGGSGYSNTIPPISASLEYGITEDISVGGLVSYSGSSYKIPTGFGDYEFTYSYIVIGARGSYHLDVSDKFDPYGGLLLGYNIASVNVNEPAGYTGFPINATSAGGIILAGHVGGRYYFNEKTAAFAELGYGISFLTLGASFKF